MSETRIIDGKAFAAGVRAEVAREVAALTAATGIVPTLAVVLAGDDPASQIYVRNKGLQTVEAGMKSREIRLPADVSAATLLATVQDLNADPEIDGILVQLPLPGDLDPDPIIEAIDPAKDVDGFHPVNVGRLAMGRSALVPCTPQGCLMLLQDELGDLSGLDALVIGRSHIVGKPMAQLLLGASCTVTIAHSRTRDLAARVGQADILVAAVGRPELVRGDWLKPGVTVIDVGMNRLDVGGDKPKLVGDVAFAEARGIARAITPVPGGVGPMTIACLLRNTLAAARQRRGVA